MDWVVCGSRALVASSQRRTFWAASPGRGQSPPAAAGRRRAGQGSSCIYPPGPPAPASSLARRMASAFFMPASSRGKQTFFWHVRCISRLKPWKIIVIFRRSRAQLGLGEGPDVAAVDEDLAARRALQHVDAAHQGALACAAHADDAVDLAVGDGQADVPSAPPPFRRRSGRSLSGVGSGSLWFLQIGNNAGDVCAGVTSVYFKNYFLMRVQGSPACRRTGPSARHGSPLPRRCGCRSAALKSSRYGVCWK